MLDTSNEKKILKIIKFAPLLFILIASIFTTFYISFHYMKNLKIEKEKIEIDYVQSNKNLIKNNIDTIYNYINDANNKSKIRLKKELTEQIYNIHSMITAIYNEFKDTKTQEEIINIIKNTLENIKYNNGRGYFSIHTMDGVNIFHGMDKKLEGTFVLNRKDIMGDYPVREAIDIAKTKGEGFLSWYYYKPDDRTRNFEKFGIVKKFEPYNMIITTAEFVEDFNKQIKAETINYLKTIEFVDKGYVFVIDERNGDFLLTRTNFTNVKKIDKSNTFVNAFYYFDNSDEKDTYLEYDYKGQYDFSSKKISYLKKVEVYDWIIGTGFNLDNLNLKIKAKQKELEKDYDEHISVALISAISMTILFLLSSMLLSKLLERKFLTHKENLEKQIQENHNQKETLLRAQKVAHIGDWKFDLKTNEIYWSDEILSIFGFTNNDKRIVSPEFVKNFIFEEDISVFEKSITNCIKEGTEHKSIYRIKRVDNEIRWLDCRGKLEDDGLSVIGTIQDITDNKNLEIEKQQKDELLYQQSKMAAMGEMIGNIAHQWRQPLSTISTASTGTKIQKEMDCLSDEDLIHSLTSINNSAQYLSKTIDDFRDFFNPSNNKVSEFDISDAISKTLNLVKAQFVAKDIEIVQNIQDCKIQSIENELIQVLINILNNARDALVVKENQRRLIFLNTYSENDTLHIEIKDNAQGIPEDIIDRIFEPYFTTKHQSQGTGIGLYMSKEIIEKHLNGKIEVINKKYVYDNIEYLGACFSIQILKK